MPDPRPGQIGSHRIYTYADWAMFALRPDPLGQACPDLCRQDYLMACSDRIAKPELRSKQRAAVKAAGGRPFGKGDALVYLGVTLAPLPGTAVSPKVLGAALSALRTADVISMEQAMAAAVELSAQQCVRAPNS